MGTSGGVGWGKLGQESESDRLSRYRRTPSKIRMSLIQIILTLCYARIPCIAVALQEQQEQEQLLSDWCGAKFRIKMVGINKNCEIWVVFFGSGTLVYFTVSWQDSESEAIMGLKHLVFLYYKLQDLRFWCRKAKQRLGQATLKVSWNPLVCVIWSLFRGEPWIFKEIELWTRLSINRLSATAVFFHFLYQR